MRCPKCGGSKSSVVDSRQAEDGNTIRRRRECEECHYRFTTYERVEERTLVVVKKDGTREQFSRDKIFNGIIRSAQKRPVSSDEIESSSTGRGCIGAVLPAYFGDGYGSGLSVSTRLL